jgi:hypothetical protein
MFLYTKAWLPRGLAGPGGGGPKNSFLLLFQANKRGATGRYHRKAGLCGPTVFFVYKICHIVY